MGNAEKRRFYNNKEKQILKVKNEKIDRQIIYLKKLHTIKKRRKGIITLRQNLINMVI